MAKAFFFTPGAEQGKDKDCKLSRKCCACTVTLSMYSSRLCILAPANWSCDGVGWGTQSSAECLTRNEVETWRVASLHAKSVILFSPTRNPITNCAFMPFAYLPSCSQKYSLHFVFKLAVAFQDSVMKQQYFYCNEMIKLGCYKIAEKTEYLFISAVASKKYCCP